MKYINVTDIITYLYCPRKLYLKKIKKIREPFTKAMFLGKLKHEALDLLNKNEQQLVESIKEKTEEREIKRKYNELLRKITLELLRKNSKISQMFDVTFFSFFPKIIKQAEKEIELRTKAIIKTINKNFLGKELWKNLSPRYLTEYSLISDKLGLKGRIDRIEFSQDKILPYELKTREKLFESDKIQLTAYAMLLENHFNKQIKKGIIESSNSRQEFEITQERRKKVLNLIKEIRQLSEKEPSITENFKKCKFCTLKKECIEK